MQQGRSFSQATGMVPLLSITLQVDRIFRNTSLHNLIHSSVQLNSHPFNTNMDPHKLENAKSQAHDGKIDSGRGTVVEMTRDEYTLATLGYRQVFVRSFGLFENV